MSWKISCKRRYGEVFCDLLFFFFFKQKTAYEIVSRDWSSDVCSSDLPELAAKPSVNEKKSKSPV